MVGVGGVYYLCTFKVDKNHKIAKLLTLYYEVVTMVLWQRTKHINKAVMSICFNYNVSTVSL